MVNQKGKMNKIVEIKIKNEKYKQTRKETKQRAEARRFILLFIYLLHDRRKEGRYFKVKRSTQPGTGNCPFWPSRCLLVRRIGFSFGFLYHFVTHSYLITWISFIHSTKKEANHLMSCLGGLRMWSFVI